MAEHTALEMQLLTSLVRKRHGLLQALTEHGGELREIEDELSYTLCSAIMSQHRPGLAVHIASVPMLIRSGMHKHFAATGYHLIVSGRSA